MKKVLLLLLSVFSSPAFASGINANSASAPCTNNTLETYSGNSNLQADWAPNTIDLRWYNNNTLLTVQSAANTCIYDGTLTIPATEPTRTGYTFAGWQVRPEIDFGTIPTNLGGTERWAKGINRDGSDRCLHQYNEPSAQHLDCNSDVVFSELQQQEWKVSFEHGDLYGMAICSTTVGETSGQTGNPVAVDGMYCWCKATGYKSINSNVISGSLNKLSWALDDYPYGTIPGCMESCATRCAAYSKSQKYFRDALFTPASN